MFFSTVCGVAADIIGIQEKRLRQGREEGLEESVWIELAVVVGLVLALLHMGFNPALATGYLGPDCSQSPSAEKKSKGGVRAALRAEHAI